MHVVMVYAGVLAAQQALARRQFRR